MSSRSSTRSPASPLFCATSASTSLAPITSDTRSTRSCSTPRSGPRATIRFYFLDPRRSDFYDDWDAAASDCVAVLLSAVGRDPHDRGTSNLVGELSNQSAEFRTCWAAHNVRSHLSVRSGRPVNLRGLCGVGPARGGLGGEVVEGLVADDVE
jgi:MmyB-like transcription regulator ligand binding domain